MKMASEVDQLEAVSLMSNAEWGGDAGEGGKANINKYPTRRTHATKATHKVQITRKSLQAVILLVLSLCAAVMLFKEGTAAGDLDLDLDIDTDAKECIG